MSGPRWANHPSSLGAQVAQLVEHATENRSVGGSTPPLGTIFMAMVGSGLTSDSAVPLADLKWAFGDNEQQCAGKTAASSRHKGCLSLSRSGPGRRLGGEAL